jgi:hypothetical protein
MLGPPFRICFAKASYRLFHLLLLQMSQSTSARQFYLFFRRSVPVSTRNKNSPTPIKEKIIKDATTIYIAPFE